MRPNEVLGAELFSEVETTWTIRSQRHVHYGLHFNVCVYFLALHLHGPRPWLRRFYDNMDRNISLLAGFGHCVAGKLKILLFHCLLWLRIDNIIFTSLNKQSYPESCRSTFCRTCLIALKYHLSYFASPLPWTSCFICYCCLPEVRLA